MAVRHGYKAYAAGCRCDQCKEAHRVYRRRYRERKAAGLTQPVAMVQLPTGGNPTVGPVESAVELEVSGLAADARPTLAAVALAVAKILDGQVPTPKPPAAKVLVSVMDALHKSPQGRRGHLASVKAMTEKGGG